MVLAYSDYVDEQWTEERWLSGAISGEQQDILFNSRGWCRFCSRPADQVYYDLNGNHQAVVRERLAYQCACCGWWQIYYHRRPLERYEMWPDFLVYRNAILRSFPVDDLEIPMDVLRAHLITHSYDVHHIHPQKLEQLVQAVFRDFFDCEVVHCGRSNDHGIDLLVIDSEKPRAIQVKRRESPDKAESVETIRAFIGAMILEERDSGVVVTTAKSFSRHALEAASRVLKVSDIESFDLVARDRFLDMLKLTTHEPLETWREYLEM